MSLFPAQPATQSIDAYVDGLSLTLQACLEAQMPDDARLFVEIYDREAPLFPTRSEDVTHLANDDDAVFGVLETWAAKINKGLYGVRVYARSATRAALVNEGI